MHLKNQAIKKQGKPAFYKSAGFLVLVSVLAVVLCAILSLVFGSRKISMQDLYNGLFGDASSSLGATVVQGRVVRTIFSLMAGVALGISGALMQAITRNPIADPSVLGVNTGAALFVVIGIAFLGISSASEYIVLALIGAGITAVFVYGIGSMGRGGATPIKLALAGTAVSAALSSLVSAIMIPRGQVMDTYRFWQVGSVGAATWSSIGMIAPFLVVGVGIAVFLGPALNSLALGDDVATGLGVNVRMVRILGAIAGVALCGAVTALAGPIGFVGLMAPHLVRLLIGADQRTLIPMSALVGACLLTVSDVLGRLIGRPGELEVGVVTAFVGAPILIIIAMRSKVRSI